MGLRPNCGVFNSDAVCILTYLLSDDAMGVYETCIAEKMSINAHVFHETWPLVLNNLVQLFMTKNELQEGDEAGLQAPQGRTSLSWNWRPDVLRLEDSVVRFFSSGESEPL